MTRAEAPGITYRSADGIAYVTLARPAVSNVFNLSMAEAFADAVWQAGGDEGERLRNARQVKGLAANLISIDRRYRACDAIRITDV